MCKSGEELRNGTFVRLSEFMSIPTEQHSANCAKAFPIVVKKLLRQCFQNPFTRLHAKRLQGKEHERLNSHYEPNQHTQ